MYANCGDEDARDFHDGGREERHWTVTKDELKVVPYSVTVTRVIHLST